MSIVSCIICRMNVTRAQRPSALGAPRPASWTFLTNHAHVLLALANDPDLRIRDVASDVGITERAAQRILHDLEEAGYVQRGKRGRRNTYQLVLDRPLRHPIEAHHTVGELVDVLCAVR